MNSTKPKIGLALGGGGARGLAHIAMLESFDETGIRPAMMVGCSMGALVGAAYAAGIPAAAIRAHATRLLSNRVDILRHVFGAKKFKLLELLSLNGFGSVLLSAEHLVRIALPAGVPDRIEELQIPMKIIATNYNTMSEHVLSEGPLIPAVAASIAIPGVISGITIGGDLHVDGGVTNPVPFNHLLGKVDKVVAIDVTGRPRAVAGRHPPNIEVAIGSLLILFHQIAGLRRERHPPDFYFEPDVTNVGSADFFRLAEILDAAGPEKQRLLAELQKLT